MLHSHAGYLGRTQWVGLANMGIIKRLDNFLPQSYPNRPKKSPLEYSSIFD